MRNEQKRHGQGSDTHTRRKDPGAAGKFARRLDCGGDGRSAGPVSVEREPTVWPAARAPGTPRDGVDQAVVGDAPGAA